MVANPETFPEVDTPYPVDNGAVYDIEIAGNYTLVGFLDVDGTVTQFDDRIHPIDPDVLGDFIADRLLIGFNSIGYDSHMLEAILAGQSREELLSLSNSLIAGQNKRWSHANIKCAGQIDLMQVTGTRVGLKALGMRLGYQHLEELPFEPGAHLDDDQKQQVADYNLHDLKVTSQLYQNLLEPLALRQRLSEDYVIDLRSSSDSDIAEKVFCQAYHKATHVDRRKLVRMAKVDLPDEVYVNVPGWWDQVTDDRVLAHGQRCFQTPITLEQTESGPKLNNRALDAYIIIGDRSYKTGLGGLHSIDGGGVWQPDDSQILADVDVTSYYPATILNQQLKPRHMTNAYTEIMRRLVDRRVTAKKMGDGVVADSLKIVINSAFGRTNYQYSALYDPQMMVQITISGQLALLWLIALIDQSSCGTVVSANTDGVTTMVDDKDAFNAVARQWQQATGYALEATRYKKLIQKDVNNYLAITESGKPKVKGVFQEENTLRRVPAGQIIARAVNAYYVRGTAVEETIRSATDIRDFLFGANSTGGALLWGGRELGKVTRYYKSTEGQRLEVRSKAGKVSKRANGDDVVIMADLPEGLPADLDFDWYIKEAKALIKTTKPRKVVGRNRKAQQLQASGLAPVPLWGGKNAAPGHKRSTQINVEAYDFAAWPNLGTSTGKKVGLLVIDIDHPDRLPASIRTNLEDTMLCQAEIEGQHDFSALRRGRAKGKFIYRFNGDLPPKSHKRTLEKYGFEVFYRDNVAVAGPRPDRKIYKLKGHLEEAPESLLRALKELAYAKGQLNAKRASVEASAAVSDDDLALLQQMLESRPEFADIVIKPHPEGRSALVCRCPADHQNPGERDLKLELHAAGRLSVSCFHETCDYVDQHAVDLVEAYGASKELAACRAARQRITEVVETLHEPTGQPATLLDAMRSDEQAVILTAPTGGGKSYSSILYALEQIAKDTAVIYVAANKSDAGQWVQQLLKITGEETLEALAGKKVYRDSWAENDESSSSDWPDLDRTNLVITHQTYLGRKGDSDLFYPIWRKLDDCARDVVVIVDELDVLIESNIRTIDLDSRFKRQQLNGDIKIHSNRLHRCPAHAHSGNCDNCFLLHDTLGWRVDSNHLFQFRQPQSEDRLPWDDYGIDPHPLLKKGDAAEWNTFRLQAIETHDHFTTTLDFTRVLRKDATYDPEAMLTSLVQSAWRPRIVQRQILDMGGNGDDGSKIYPPTPCGIRMLVLADTAPFIGLKRYAGKIRLLTATLTEPHRAFLEDVLPDTPIYRINAKAPMLDTVGVLVVDHNLSRKKITQLASLQTTLLLTAYKRDMARFMVKIPNQVVGIFRESLLSAIEVDAVDSGRPCDILISYMGSTLSRGINLPRYKTVITSGTPFKPTAASLSAEITPSAIEEANLSEMLILLQQGIGRVLRLEEGEQGARRLVIILNPLRDQDGSVVEPADLVTAIQERTNNPVQLLISKSEPETFAATKAWVAGEGLPAATIQTDSSKLTRRKRKVTANAREEAKEARRLERREAKRAEIKEDLMTGRYTRWRDFSRKWNLARYFDKTERASLKEIFHCKNSEMGSAAELSSKS